ncbi:MAG TPA: HAD-IA family hydrolase [Gaiellales bacterium]|jgi:HAD superfamily hydrolase (TIGR01509 family)
MARYDAVLLDAYGTLVELDDPFERLRAAIRRHLGVDIDREAAERAFRAEMEHYSAGCHVAADADSLTGFRAECARVLIDGLPVDADLETGERVLSDAVAFRVLPDVRALLAGLQEADVATAVVSNWDYSLRRTLAGIGLEFDAIVTCGETGVRKPDPRIFAEALGRLGVEPARALHIGDRADSDGAGARAAGIDVRIVDRAGTADGRDTIAALTDVLELL